MADTLALELLFDQVAARFAHEGTDAANMFGWRVPPQQVIGNRVAWVPGDPGGSLGEEMPARNPGRDPRPIATLRERFTVIVSAGDPEHPEDERAAYKAARLLRDAWHRAVYLAARGTFGIVSENWLIDKAERRYGAAIRIVAWVEAMVPDAPFVPTTVDARPDSAQTAMLPTGEIELDQRA